MLCCSSRVLSGRRFYNLEYQTLVQSELSRIDKNETTNRSLYVDK